MQELSRLKTDYTCSVALVRHQILKSYLHLMCFLVARICVTARLSLITK